MSLLDPIDLGGRVAPNRLLFGPHETNLGRGREISDRHVAYYLRRAAGGAGIIVTEEASVHPSDWPYERAPLAAECGSGWRAVADAVHSSGMGTLVFASIGHAGGQGSTAYSQQPLLAPSRVPEVNSREVPKWMELDDIVAVVRGFGDAARLASSSGMDGVEVNAGQYSLVRQFLSGLTNQRDDEWGSDRLRFAREVLEATRAGLERGAPGAGSVLGLRLSCDELAPWAGITPEMALDVAIELAPLVDYLVVVRGSIFTTSATRPDFHELAGFNRKLCAQLRTGLRAAGHDVPVVLQGSMVDIAQSEGARAEGECDLVEMTRAQIADPALGMKHAAGVDEQIRPCVLCNQMCMVRDARNPIVSCVVEPSSGHELDDPSPVPDGPNAAPVTVSGQPVFIVGGGPAGLEAARVAALRGHPVRLVDRGRGSSDQDGDEDDGSWSNFAPEGIEVPEVPAAWSAFGGMVAQLGSSRDSDKFWRLCVNLFSECMRLGVRLEVGVEVTASDLEAAVARGEAVILATGSIDGTKPYEVDDAALRWVYSAAGLAGDHDVFASIQEGMGLEFRHLVVLDPIGGPIGVAAAESVADHGITHLVTQDNIAGNELARTGDLAPANVRLQQLGVHIERRSLVRAVRATESVDDPEADEPVEVELEDRFSGERRTIRARLVIDAGFRLPDESLWDATGRSHVRAGDCVAPRTVHEAILEGRRAAIAIEGTPR